MGGRWGKQEEGRERELKLVYKIKKIVPKKEQVTFPFPVLEIECGLHGCQMSLNHRALTSSSPDSIFY